MIITIDVENVCDKIHHALMVKVLEKEGPGETVLNITTANTSMACSSQFLRFLLGPLPHGHFTLPSSFPLGPSPRDQKSCLLYPVIG